MDWLERGEYELPLHLIQIILRDFPDLIRTTIIPLEPFAHISFILFYHPAFSSFSITLVSLVCLKWTEME